MRVLTFLVVGFWITSAFAQEVPTIRYKITMSPEGEPVVEKVDDGVEQSSTAMGVPNEDMTESPSQWQVELYQRMQEALITQGTAYFDDPDEAAWVVTDAAGTIVAAGEVGNQKIIDAMKTGEGYKMQRVGWNKFLFGASTSLEEMEESIKLQMRRAAAAFQTEACQTMRNWKEVKFAFELGADAVVVAKINGEGTFVPADVCP
ncbi:hypothetical protein [Hoeflea sp.]|uniref:hypothetical protein n=1 Tax=Hoeflea sp. TaxID=1940281 RepID=UPI003B525F2E